MSTLALALTAALVTGFQNASPPQENTPQDAPPELLATDLTESVIKVFSQQRYPDFMSPWSKKSPSETTGSGVVIEGRRVLTNAHVVQWTTRVELQANRSSRKYPAKVVGIAPAVDLALLEVTRDADDFFAGRPPLELQAELPTLMESVNVYGYPMGGSDLSVTEGIISRIEYAGFSLDRSGLIVQIDAAINPGNSGGPAIVGDRLIGLATSRLSSGDNIGFLTPSAEIRAFLEDIADGEHEGRPKLFDRFQTLENESLRARLGVGHETTGLVVTTPAGLDGEYPLKPLDVITHVGERDIAVDGKVSIRGDLRLDFMVLVPEYAANGSVPLRVFRAGEHLDLRVPVAPSRNLLVGYLGNGYPSYFIHGPLAFSPCYREFAMSLVGAYTERLIHDENPLLARMNEVAAADGESLVMLLPTLFDHHLTRGYGGPQFCIVESLGGTRVRNLRHLVELLRDSTDPYLDLTFAGRGQERLIFDRAELEQATEEILNDNGIRYRHSPDLDGVWPRDR